jgi:hypothetical protein
MRTIYLTFPIILILLIACKKEDNLSLNVPLIGQWGGKGINIVASETDVTFDFDCATGIINRKVMVSSNQFSERGTFKLSVGNAPIIGDGPKPQNVQYEAKVNGNDINLDIMSEDGKTLIGTYTATKDTSGKLFRCL